MFLPVPVALEFKQRIQSFLKTYTQLAAQADAQGDVLWSEPSKFHWLWHLGDRALYMNPRTGSTLLDEDLVGKIKFIVQSCAHGTPGHLVPSKVMVKIQWLMHCILLYGVDKD